MAAKKSVIDTAISSFGREIGRNYGKVVSNRVFKDKWSTPHRFKVTTQATPANPKMLSTDNMSADNYSTPKKRGRPTKAEVERREREEKERIRAEEEARKAERIKSIATISVPDEINDLCDTIAELLSLGKAIIAKDKTYLSNDDTEVRVDKQSSAEFLVLMEKIENLLFKLNKHGCIEEIKFYTEKYNALNIEWDQYHKNFMLQARKNKRRISFLLGRFFNGFTEFVLNVCEKAMFIFFAAVVFFIIGLIIFGVYWLIKYFS